VDYADLYFQFTRSESWSLEEGIVKTGSFSIDQGVGVRAVSGDKTAFSYSDEISEHALLQAAAATRTIARQGAGRIKVASTIQPGSARALYSEHDPLASLDATAKVKLVEKIERIARAKDPRVSQVMAGLSGEYDVVLVVRSDGVIAADIRPLVRLSLTVIAEQNGRVEQGHARPQRLRAAATGERSHGISHASHGPRAPGARRRQRARRRPPGAPVRQGLAAGRPTICEPQGLRPRLGLSTRNVVQS
jgi:predicted Zn-dependent protease